MRDPHAGRSRAVGLRRLIARSIVVGAIAVAVSAAPLVSFAYRSMFGPADHGGAFRVTSCTQRWLAYLPTWSCTGDYQGADPMAGDGSAQGTPIDDPRHHAVGDLIDVQEVPGSATTTS